MNYKTKFKINNWFLALDLQGGRILELSNREKKIFGTYTRLDGKLGSTHICAPSFDKEGQDPQWNLPFHGYARTLDWIVEKQTETGVTISTHTAPTPTYNALLKLSQTFTMDQVFLHSVAVENIKGNAVPVNVGLHYYWDTPQGWDDLTINNKSQMTNVKENGHCDLQEVNDIKFPHASYTLTSHGFQSAALWTSFTTNTMDIKQYSQDFCCIEPIIKWPGYFGSEESVIELGTSKVVKLEISIPSFADATNG